MDKMKSTQIREDLGIDLIQDFVEHGQLVWLGYL